MIKPPVPQEINRANLLRMSALLSGTEHFAFFGTLLGLVRDGDVIAGDDDVDLYVHEKDRDRALSVLSGNGVTIERDVFPNTTPYFTQCIVPHGDLCSYVDLYFFEADAGHDQIVERWNFLGRPEDPERTLHTPQALVYPLQPRRFFGHALNLPARPEAVCAHLYGDDWRTPKAKGVDYKIAIQDNTPRLLKMPE